MICRSTVLPVLMSAVTLSFAATPLMAQNVATINFGDDASRWSNDGECDDPRFAGPGMTNTTLLESDRGHDATDCRRAWEAGQLRLASVNRVINGIDFGDDASRWSNDGECDDPRFAGPGMTATTLLESDRGHDATDCMQAWQAGQLRLASQGRVINGIDFGDDASRWSNDGECDDPRFAGPGMTNTTLLESDRGHDATDCMQAWQAGQLRLASQGNRHNGIDFGDDASRWANDGECDDPRFRGPGMTNTTLLESDRGHDATDCLSAYRAGRLQLR